MTAQPRRRADAQRNREAILSAGRTLILTRGPGIGMDDIAAEAGLAVGTLYRHFPAKKDLVEAIVTELSASVMEYLDTALTRVGSGETTALDELVELLRRVMIDMRQERLLRYAVTSVAEDSLRALQEQGRAAVVRLVDAAHRDRLLYPDVTVEDVILLLATSPDDALGEPAQQRWLALAERALAGRRDRDLSAK
ncbi:TetR/AcrR family transcriptional regulator [Nocardia abscessus]|uniref:TetR/AcrR family transcriptional regulator n=1 Tax=Nocardia abscessus TaxID=120957 RepID=UPI002458CDC1|nr:helix-turn-helix domain-containing protein [Nocardia abscessus]